MARKETLHCTQPEENSPGIGRSSTESDMETLLLVAVGLVIGRVLAAIHNEKDFVWIDGKRIEVIE